MADRMFLPPGGGLELDIIELYGTITIGSTGAVSASSGKGISAVVRNSAGQYKVTLTDTYSSFLWANAVVLNTADSDPTSVGVTNRVKAQAVTSATPTVTFQFYNVATGAAADPASGAVIYVALKLKNSSV